MKKTPFKRPRFLAHESTTLTEPTQLAVGFESTGCCRCRYTFERFLDLDFWVESWLPSFIETHGAEQVNKLLSNYRSE